MPGIDTMTTTDLEQLRQQLAYRAGQGEDVTADLDAVEDQLDRLARQQQREHLAKTEATRRA